MDNCPRRDEIAMKQPEQIKMTDRTSVGTDEKTSPATTIKQPNGIVKEGVIPPAESESTVPKSAKMGSVDERDCRTEASTEAVAKNKEVPSCVVVKNDVESSGLEVPTTETEVAKSAAETEAPPSHQRTESHGALRPQDLDLVKQTSESSVTSSTSAKRQISFEKTVQRTDSKEANQAKDAKRAKEKKAKDMIQEKGDKTKEITEKEKKGKEDKGKSDKNGGVQESRDEIVKVTSIVDGHYRARDNFYRRAIRTISEGRESLHEKTENGCCECCRSKRSGSVASDVYTVTASKPSVQRKKRRKKPVVVKMTSAVTTPEPPDIKPYDVCFKVMLLGDVNVGKTSLIKYLSGDRFDPHERSTIGIDFVTKMFNVDGARVKLEIWDMPGQERFNTPVKNYFQDMKGVVLVYDVTNYDSFVFLHEKWLHKVDKDIDKYRQEPVPVYLAGNKADVATSDPAVTESQGREMDSYLTPKERMKKYGKRDASNPAMLGTTRVMEGDAKPAQMEIEIVRPRPWWTCCLCARSED